MTKKERLEILQGLQLEDTSQVEEAMLHVLIDMNKSSSSKFAVPTPEMVADYAKTIKFDLDGHRFCDHYAARGWMVGKTKMKDWKAAVRTWKGNGYSNGQGKAASGAVSNSTLCRICGVRPWEVVLLEVPYCGKCKAEINMTGTDRRKKG